MSATVVAGSAVATTSVVGRQKIEPWTLKDLKKNDKSAVEFATRAANGLNVLPPDDKYTANVRALATEFLQRVERLHEAFDELYDSTETKRVTSIKPRLCDRALTDLLSQHFMKHIPESGQYGVIDLNRIAPRAISLYVKEKNLGGSQFFTLDDALYRLFNAPSIEDKTKTYLQLAQQRIEQLHLESGYRSSPSSAKIDISNGRVTMNYSALKIIIPKFGVDYDINNPQDYVQNLEQFAEHLEVLNNQHIENKKALKKSTKTK